jgi:sodium-dependent dicarboxylate transporter 2/3/5
MIPATLAASLGFMMPIATAGNTIVFSSGHIKTKEMAVAGFVANLTGIVLITLICYLAFA